MRVSTPVIANSFTDKIKPSCTVTALTTSLLVAKNISQTTSELHVSHLTGKHASRVSAPRYYSLQCNRNQGLCLYLSLKVKSQE